jgi:predicted heme/steroid binding protein
VKRASGSLVIVLVLLSALGHASWATATEEYALRTGKNCDSCHRDPAGGGELTEEGIRFQRTIGKAAAPVPQSPILRAVRFVAGFVHLFTAILWFGTILYVHVILKPAYAAQGIPKGELRLGLASMAVMAVTGTILTLFRIPSLDVLFHSRFGILLTIKIGVFLVMVGTAIVVVVFIRPRLQSKANEKSVPAKGDMTLEELAACDGRQGRPAYIVYEGKIRDVSGLDLWRGGVHFGRHRAGEDLTTYLWEAPHDEEVVLECPVVGNLLTAPREQERIRPPHERVFYAMAYMNLGLVVVITLIVALWRWW